MFLFLILVAVVISAIVRLIEAPFRYGYRRRGWWGGGYPYNGNPFGYNGYSNNPYGYGYGYGYRRHFGLGRGLLTAFLVLGLLRLFGRCW